MDNDTIRWLITSLIMLATGTGGAVGFLTMREQVRKLKAETANTTQQTRIGEVTLDRDTLDLLRAQIDTVEDIARKTKEELADAQKRIRALEAEAAIKDAEHAVKLTDLEKRLDAVTLESSRVTSELEARVQEWEGWGDEVENSVRVVPEPIPTEIFSRVKRQKPERLNRTKGQG